MARPFVLEVIVWFTLGWEWQKSELIIDHNAIASATAPVTDRTELFGARGNPALGGGQRIKKYLTMT